LVVWKRPQSGWSEWDIDVHFQREDTGAKFHVKALSQLKGDEIVGKVVYWDLSGKEVVIRWIWGHLERVGNLFKAVDGPREGEHNEPGPGAGLAGGLVADLAGWTGARSTARTVIDRARCS
jgi:hypothetical protein